MSSDLGKSIISSSVEMIKEFGFESFTFKKLAERIESTEAGIYRYFENKHRLLVYLLDWYWSWLEYVIKYKTNNLTDCEQRLKLIIKILVLQDLEEFMNNQFINYRALHQIVISEAAKTFLTKNVDEDNKIQLFKPYKDLCKHIADIIQEFNCDYKFPRSLSSTIIEMSHYQNFFMKKLPALTDFGGDKDEKKLVEFLEDLLFSSARQRG